VCIFLSKYSGTGGLMTAEFYCILHCVYYYVCVLDFTKQQIAHRL